MHKGRIVDKIGDTIQTFKDKRAERRKKKAETTEFYDRNKDAHTLYLNKKMIREIETVYSENNPKFGGMYGELDINVHIIDESNNPFGTFKDRRNLSVLKQDADKEEEQIYVHITSGNSGFSLGSMCKEWERNCRLSGIENKKRTAVVIIDKNTNKKARKELRKLARKSHGAVIVKKVDLSKELHPNDLKEIAHDAVKKRVSLSQIKIIGGIAEKEQGYNLFAQKILTEHPNPKMIFLPLGSGELFYNTASAIIEICEKEGKIIPKIVAVTSKGSCFSNFERLKNETDIEYRKRILNIEYRSDGGVFVHTKESSGAPSLETPTSPFWSKIKKLMLKYSKLQITCISKEELENEMKVVGNEYNVEPASVAAFAGARKILNSEKIDLKDKDDVVIINTGKGVNPKMYIKPKWWVKPAIYITSAVVLFVAGMSAYKPFYKNNFTAMQDAEDYVIEQILYEQYQKNSMVMTLDNKEDISEVRSMDISLRYIEQRYTEKYGELSIAGYMKFLNDYGINTERIDTSIHYYRSGGDTIVYAYRFLPPRLSPHMMKVIADNQQYPDLWVENYYPWERERAIQNGEIHCDTVYDCSVDYRYRLPSGDYGYYYEELGPLQKLKARIKGIWNSVFDKSRIVRIETPGKNSGSTRIIYVTREQLKEMPEGTYERKD
ncbi:PLP-dependent lyase/thiolase [Candidatus Micrarchaeota archaeon]|nr:PLP-dependent lyase/thiolase [Candidatus Micrarchaeota archaeon]